MPELEMETERSFMRLSDDRGKWLSTLVMEDDLDDRPNLRTILEAIGDRGTIVVPHLSHITKKNERLSPLIEKLDTRLVAVISVKGNALRGFESDSLLDAPADRLVDLVIRSGLENVIRIRQHADGYRYPKNKKDQTPRGGCLE